MNSRTSRSRIIRDDPAVMSLGRRLEIRAAAFNVAQTAQPLDRESRMPKLLVIDDDRSVRHLVRQAFDGSGIEIIDAATAEEGLDVLRRQTPDTVLLDIGLPEMSGLEAFRDISCARSEAARDLHYGAGLKRCGDRSDEHGCVRLRDEAVGPGNRGACERRAKKPAVGRLKMPAPEVVRVY